MDSEFPEVNWREVLDRLRLAAYRLFGIAKLAGYERVLESFGIGPEDLANDVLMSFISRQAAKRSWDTAAYGEPNTRSVFKYLERALINDFNDKDAATRRKTQQSLYTDGDEGGNRASEPIDANPSPEAIVLHRDAVEKAKARMAQDFTEHPDSDLERYFELQFDGDRYLPYKPRGAAAQLRLDVREIYLLKDKLERRIYRIFGTELSLAQVKHRRKESS